MVKTKEKMVKNFESMLDFTDNKTITKITVIIDNDRALFLQDELSKRYKDCFRDEINRFLRTKDIKILDKIVESDLWKDDEIEFIEECEYHENPCNFDEFKKTVKYLIHEVMDENKEDVKKQCRNIEKESVSDIKELTDEDDDLAEGEIDLDIVDRHKNFENIIRDYFGLPRK